jgi:phosphoglycerate dehydrogenase-like enzyme
MTTRARAVPTVYCGLALALCIGVLGLARADDQSQPPPLPPIDALIRDLGLVAGQTPVRKRADWAPLRKVLVPALDPQLLPHLRTAVPGVEFVVARDAAEAARLAPGVDAAVGFCTLEVLAAAPKLRWIQVLSAGVERCVAIPAVRERGLLLTNMQRVAGPVMAEHVMALMLAFSRSLQFYIPEQRAGRWTPDVPPPARSLELRGKTVLVAGLGGIGTEVARRAHAFGMQVTATRASGREGPPFVSYVGLPDELPALAREADFVVNTLPLTDQTRGLFDAKLFAAMKPGAIFINVGRGGSVVQDDLVAALRSGRLAGAGLDVTDPEPLPAGHPLYSLPNVIITPHVAADTDLGNAARWAIVRENLGRYAAGEAMLSEVALEKGY